MADLLDDRKARIEDGLVARARQRAGLPVDAHDREALERARALAVPRGGAAAKLGVTPLAEHHWLRDLVLGACASCDRSDLPLRLQVSGAYSLCVRCEEIARAELSEVA